MSSMDKNCIGEEPGMKYKRSFPDELEAAHADGDYHRYLGAKIDQLVALHEAGKMADKTYRGDDMAAMIAMLRACDLALWQLKEACGYPIPNAVDDKYPRRLNGNCGENPFQCGICAARKSYPDLHLKSDAERHGGMYIAPDEFKKV